MDKINVLVTGIGGGGNGEQVLKALKFSNDLDLNIIGTDITEYTAGRRFVDVFCKVPPVIDPVYEKVIFDIIDKYDVRFIFHGSEPELAYLSENREKFLNKGVRCYLNSKELISLCMNKVNTYKKLESLGYEMPKYSVIGTIEDINKIDFYPVVLKPYIGSGGSSHVYIAVDSDEAFLLGSYMLKRSIKVVAQEYLGSHEDEYTIGTSSNENGDILGSIVVKKIIGNVMSTRLKVKHENNMYVISSGFSQGEVCHMPELQRQAEDMAVALNSKGPLNIQCRLVNAKLMLMEINPRTSGTTSLRAIAGYNEPEMIIKYYANNEKWKSSYKNIVIMRGLEEYAF
jgi:carbamoyl-phosphate synthase large subunit